MAVASAAFECAERIVGPAATAAHHSIGVLHPRPMTFEHSFVLPAIDRAGRRLLGDAATAQGACVAAGFAAHVADLDPAARVGLAARGRLQERAGGATVSVECGVVAELFMAAAALLLQPAAAPS